MRLIVYEEDSDAILYLSRDYISFQITYDLKIMVQRGWEGDYIEIGSYRIWSASWYIREVDKEYSSIHIVD